MSRSNAKIAAGLLAIAGTFAAGAAQAHTGGGHGEGLAHGFAHPLFGLDHLLAMVAVGIFAAQKGGRALWIAPASFVGMMVVGFLAAMAGIALPMVEIGIVGSLIVLGGAVLFADKVPFAVGAVLAGFLAIFHGHAHGTELAEGASAATYVVGFVLATALLHGAGLGLGLLANKSAAVAKANALRYSGAAIALVGVALFAA